MVGSQKNKLKVLVFVDFFYPHINGMGMYIQEIYSPLIKQGKVELHVLTFNNTNSKKIETHKQIEIYRAKCHPILSATYNLPEIGDWNKLKEILSREDFDIVNTHTRFFISSFLGTRFAKKNNIFHIHTEHGAMFVPHPNKIVKLCSRLYDETFGRYVMRNSSHVVTVSGAGRTFSKRLGAKDVRVIYNGISEKYKIWTKKEEERISREYDLSKRDYKIVFVGRLVEAKGVQDLIKATQSLNFNFRLFIIGDGNYRSELEKLVNDLNLTKNVIFLGFRDIDFIRNFLTKMDLFVNPSYAEGFPTSVLEAGISKIKVIATDVGGTKEILSGTKEGFLVRPEDVRQLKETIIRTKNLKTTNSLFNKISKFYMWDVLSNDLYELLSRRK